MGRFWISASFYADRMHDPVLRFYDEHAPTYAADSVTHPHPMSFLQRGRQGSLPTGSF